MAFFKRTPREPMIRVDAHKDIVADIEANRVSELAIQRASFEQAIGIERDTVARLVAANRALRVENATLRAEQERRKAQARANLKQFKAREKAA